MNTNVREMKGKSKIEFIQNYIVLDIETTGFSPAYDSIIEIAAIKIENGTVIDKFQSLINPGCLIDEFTIKLTGISNELLESAPTFNNIMKAFVNFIGDNIIVGHNVNFDINFIYDYCLKENIYFKNDFIDTLRLSRMLFKNLKSHKLNILSEELNLPNKPDHRALIDSYCTYDLYEYIKKYVSENNLDFKSLYAKKLSKSIRAADIICSSDEFDESHPLFGKVCVFTGTLEQYTRKEAMQIVANFGGINGDSVTKKTNFLILGNNDYCSSIKDGKSNKHKKAEALILQGSDLIIIPESVFYDMINDYDN